MFIMLTVYRRHIKRCPHRGKGRRYRRCRCPLWVDGFLSQVEIRKSLGLLDWENAQQLIREWEAEGTPVQKLQTVSVKQAHEEFLSDARDRKLRESTLKKYSVLFRQIDSFAAESGLLFLRQWDVATLRSFRRSWVDGGISALKKLERLRAFFRFAHESGWIAQNPATKLKEPQVEHPPTMPFNQEEMINILAACTQYPDNYRRTGQANSQRIRALVLLLRYSGLRIGDAATCPTNRLSGDKVFLYTHKTGVPVNVKLPSFVVEALESAPRISEQYFFWTGTGKTDTVSGNWRRALRRVFRIADVLGGHPHRFRDTFAVELLRAGVPLERVSVLLGHKNIRVTQRHYAPWVSALQEQLEADLERCWAADPIVFRETKGTPKVRGKTEAIN